ncbi:MAG: helicase-related protein, partial [Proteobacteria bacterium]|nr:helicase-related protein [Pseudomonadota bacterium]
DSILKNPVRVEVAPVSSTSDQVSQRLYYVAKADKRKLLLHIMDHEAVTRGLVFTRTKHNANKLEDFLAENGVKAAAIHGNKSQGARQKALEGFRDGKVQILVASDLAARGIDINEISHVINFEMPNEPETYVHRIGRTGRAAAVGLALSFCDQEERKYVTPIERLTKRKIPVVEDHPFAKAGAKDAPYPVTPVRVQNHHSRNSRQGRRNSGENSGGNSGGNRGNFGGQGGSRNRPSGNSTGHVSQGTQRRGSSGSKPS